MRRILSTPKVIDRHEVQLLLCCARTSKNPEITKRIEALLGEDIDWEYLLRIAYKHRVASLLCWHLDATLPEAVPEGTMNRLRSSFRATSLHNLTMIEKLLGLLEAFEALDILAVPLKGPILAATVYDNLALREFIDLDVLVHTQDVPKAKELLTSLGYRPDYQLTPAQEAAFLRYEREYTFVHNDTSDILELHWQLAPRTLSVSVNTDHVWERLMQVSLGGHTVLAFSPEDLLMYLCAHGSGHLWARLAWICDVAQVIDVYEGMDWEQLVTRASASGSERILFLGLLLASDLLEANLPESVSNKVRADAAVGALAGRVHELLFRETEDSQEAINDESHFQPLHLKMLDRKRDRVRYYIRQGTAPILKDWALRPLPASLFPLYRVLRPIRLAGKYGQKVLRRVYD